MAGAALLIVAGSGIVTLRRTGTENSVIAE